MVIKCSLRKSKADFVDIFATLDKIYSLRVFCGMNIIYYFCTEIRLLQSVSSTTANI